MASNTIKMEGNLCATPDLMGDGTDGKKAWGKARVACTPRRYDKTEEKWVDGTTTYMTVYLEGMTAIGAARTLQTGWPVAVTGILVTKEWTGKDGQVHRDLVVNADTIALVIRGLRFQITESPKTEGSARAPRPSKRAQAA